MSQERSIRSTRRTAEGEVVIGFFNTMWGMALDATGLPPYCRLTTDHSEFAVADAIVYHIPTHKGPPREIRPGQLRVAWSMESEANYQRLVDPRFMRHFDLTMTYRLDADVPVTYISFYQGDGVVPGLRMPPGPKSSDKLVSVFISSGINQSGREGYLAELMQLLDVHSYGRHRRNRPLRDGDRGQPSKMRTISQYKFDLAFENSICDDYVTEKFYDPLLAGTVPVYLGAPNVGVFAPGEKCYINTADFSGPRDLAEYLLYLDQDDAAYAEYFAWKELPFRPEFQRLMRTESNPAFARLCETVRDRKNSSDTAI